MECKSCHKAVTGLLCEHCGTIAPPRLVDRFAVLGVPRHFGLAESELETRYRELSRKLHPDRFAKAPAAERMLSLQAATTLNDAFRTLKVPVKRAEYLLELAGVKLTDSTEGVDPGFLMEILELREELVEARVSGDAARLAAMGADMLVRRDRALAAVAAKFEEHERTGERALLEGIKEELIALRYFQRFLDEHEGRSEEI